MYPSAFAQHRNRSHSPQSHPAQSHPAWGRHGRRWRSFIAMLSAFALSVGSLLGITLATLTATPAQAAGGAPATLPNTGFAPNWTRVTNFKADWAQAINPDGSIATDQSMGPLDGQSIYWTTDSAQTSTSTTVGSTNWILGQSYDFSPNGGSYKTRPVLQFERTATGGPTITALGFSTQAMARVGGTYGEAQTGTQVPYSMYFFSHDGSTNGVPNYVTCPANATYVIRVTSGSPDIYAGCAPHFGNILTGNWNGITTLGTGQIFETGGEASQYSGYVVMQTMFGAFDTQMPTAAANAVNTSAVQFTVWDPQTGNWVASGPIMPSDWANGSAPSQVRQELYATSDSVVANPTKPSAWTSAATTDAAADFGLAANGDLYMYTGLDTTGTNSNMALVHITPAVNASGNYAVPSATNPWTYTVATKLQKTYSPESWQTASWFVGTGIHNGQFYGTGYGTSNNPQTSPANTSTSVSGTPSRMVQMNPLTGKAQEVGSSQNDTTSPGATAGTTITTGPTATNPATDGSAMRDAASPQQLNVIEGYVYNDVKGDGNVAEDGYLGVQGVDMALYDATNTMVGSEITGPDGSYSFITSGDGTFTVRVVQPQIGGVNAVQSWGGGYTGADVGVGGTGNASTINCINGGITSGAGTPNVPATGSACYGAVAAPYFDPVPTMGATADPSTFPISASVNMNTDSDVAYADFGITTMGSYGDAAKPPFNSTLANGGPWLATAQGNDTSLYLGATPGYYADGTQNASASAHTTDDGISIKDAHGDLIGLQSTAVAGGRTTAVGDAYTIEGAMSGSATAVANSQLVGWAAQPSSTTLTGTLAPTMQAKTSSGVADASYSTGAASTLVTAQARFAALPQSVTPTGPDNTANGWLTPAGSTATSGNQPWASIGEIEDYQYYVAPALVRVAANLESGTAPASAFGYTLSNVSASAPSTTTDSITLTATNSVVVSPTVHSVGTLGSALGVTASGIPSGYMLDAGNPVSCFDTTTGADVASTMSGTTATVTPQLGDDTICQFNYQQEPSLTNSSLTVTPMAGPSALVHANGSDSYTATATVEDGSGTPMSGVTVAFSLDNNAAGAGVLSAPSCVTGADGTCSVTLTSTAVATYPVHATVAQADTTQHDVSGSPQPASFVAGAADPATSMMQLVDPSDGTTLVPADGATSPTSVTTTAGTSVTAKVTLADAQNHPTSGQTATITVTNTDGMAGTGATLTDSQGMSTTPDASGNLVGTCVSGADGTCTVTFSAQKDGTYSVAAQVPASATDSTLTNVVNAPETIDVTSSTPTPTCNPPAGESNPLTPGLTVVNTPATVSDPSGAGVTLTQTVTDQYCNPIQGAAVDFAGDGSASGTAMPTPYTYGTPSGTTGGDGTVTTKLTDTMAETVTTTATVADASLTAPLTYTADAAFKADSANPSATMSTLTVSATSAAINTGQVTATATINDQFGNPVAAGTPVTFTICQTGTTCTATTATGAATVSTNGQGQAQITIADPEPETVDVHATIDQAGTPTDLGDAAKDATTASPQTVEFTGSNLPDGTASTWSMAPCLSNIGAAQVVANGTDCYQGTLTLADAGGVALPNVAAEDISYTLSSGSGVTVTQGTASGNVYTATFTTTTPGTPTVTVRAEGVAITNLTATSLIDSTNNTAYDLAFVAGTADATTSLLALSTDNPQGTIGTATTPATPGTPGSIAANNDVTATVTALDASGTPVADGTTVTFTVPSSSATFGGASSATTTTVNGVATATFLDTKAELVTVTATIGSPTTPDATLTGSVTFTQPIVSAQYSTFTLTPCAGNASSSQVVADGKDCYTGTIYAADDNDKPIQNLTASDIAIASSLDSAGTTAVPGYDGLTVTAATPVSGQPGYYTVQFTATTATTYYATATVAGTTLTGPAPQPQPMAFVSGAPDPNPGPCTDPDLTGTNLSPATSSVGVGSSVTLTAHITDANCNPVKDVPVYFSVGTTPANTATVTAASPGTTDAHGDVTATVTDNKADTGVPVHASLTSGGSDINQSPVTVDFVAGGFSTTDSTLTVTPCAGNAGNPAAADGNDCWTATITAVDSHGDPLTNLTASQVAFTSSSPSTVTPKTGSVTQGTGVNANQYSETFVSTKAATTTMTAAYNTATLVQSDGTTPQQGTLTYVAGAADAGASTLSVDPTSATAAPSCSGAPAGSCSVTATLTINDKNGNPVQGATPTVTTSTSTATTMPTAGSSLPACSAGTNAQGRCVVDITDTTVETTMVSATVHGGSIPTVPATANNQVPVAFGFGSVSATNSTVTVNPSSTAAGNNVTVTVSVKDGNNNPVDGLSAGDVAVSGTYASGANPNSAVTPSFVVDPTSFKDLGSGVYTYTATSDLAATFDVGAAVEGVAITGPLPVTPVTATFTAGGVCTAGATPQDTSVPNKGLTGFALTKDQQQANGTAADQVTAYAYDCYGNPVSGAAVVLNDQTAAPRNGLLVPQTVSTTSGADGSVVMSLTTHTAGTYQVAGTIGGLTPAVPGANPTFVSGSVSASASTLVVTPSSLTVGSAATVTVDVKDADGNPVTDVIPTVTVDDPANATLSVLSCTAGVCTGTLNSTVAGTYHVTATVPDPTSTTGNVSGSPAPVTFTAGTICIAPACTPTPPPGVDPATVTTGVVVDPNGVQANGVAVDVATVSAFDQYGNPVSGARVATTNPDPSLIVVTGTGTTGALTSATPGQAVLTYASDSATSQHATVTITDPSDATNTPQAVPPTPIELDFIASAVDPAASTLTVTPATSQAVNNPFTLTAHAQDAQGNPVSGATITWSAAAGATLSASTCKTGDSGDCSVSVNSTTAGAYQVGATVPDAAGVATPLGGGSDPALASPQTVTWTAGSLCIAPACTPAPGVTNVTGVTVKPNGVANDGTSRDVATVSAYDAWGNPVVGATVASTATGSHTASLATQQTINPTDSNGISTIYYTSTVAGSYNANVTLVDPSNMEAGPQAVPPSPITLLFGSGLVDPDTSFYTISPAGPLTVGQDAASAYTVTVTANDAMTQPVAGAVISFGMDKSGPVWSTNPATCTTLANGQCSVTVTSTVAGTYNVLVTAGTASIPPQTGEASSVAWQSDDVCASGCTPEPGTSPSQYTTVAIGTNNMTADGMSQDTAIVTAFDKWGNPVPGVTVGVTPDSSLNLVVTPPFTDVNGQSVVSFTSTKAGDHIADFTVKKLASATQTPSGSPLMTINFVPGLPDPADSYLWLSPTSATPTAPGPATTPAPGPMTATVTVVDAHGNAVPNVPVTFTVNTSTAGSATVANATSAITVNSDANGVATAHISDTIAETTPVSATMADPVSGTATNVKFSPTTATFTKTTPAAPVVTSPTPNEIVGTGTPTITGTAVPGTTVTVVDIPAFGTPTPVCTAIVQDDGTWTCTPLMPIADGSSTLSVTATDPANTDPATNTSPATTVPVQIDTSTPGAPTITSPTDGLKTNDNRPTVTGTGVPGDQITLTDGNGTVLCTTTVQPGGAYTCAIPPAATLPNGTATLNVTQTNPNNGNVSPAKTVSIDVNKTTLSTPAITTANATTVAGTSDKGTTVTLTWPDGTTAKVPVNPDGTWSVSVPAGMPSGTVTAVAQDPYGNVSQPGKAHLDTTVAGAPTFTTANATTVAGTTTGAEKGSTLTVTWPDGTVQSGIPLDSDGSFSIPTPAGMPSGEITAVVVGPGPAYNTSPKGMGHLDTDIPAAPQVDPTDGSQITGTADPGDTITVTDQNGTPIPGCTNVTSDASGAFSCAPTVPPAAGSKVLVSATDLAGNTSPTTVVTVQQRAAVATGGTVVSNVPAVVAGWLCVVAMMCLGVVIARRRKATRK